MPAGNQIRIGFVHAPGSHAVMRSFDEDRYPARHAPQRSVASPLLVGCTRRDHPLRQRWWVVARHDPLPEQRDPEIAL
jgi:hypothetical protein